MATVTCPSAAADERPVAHDPGSARPLLTILALGAALRLALWAAALEMPLNIWDERDYDTLAVNLVRHGEFAFTPGTPATLRPPLYPAVVAGVYAVFGVQNYAAVRLLQAALSLINVLLLYRLGAEAHSRRAGLWAAGLFAFYPSLLGFNNLLLTETLFTLLLCAFVYLTVRALRTGSLPGLAAAGLALGLAALTRSVVWLFPPVLAVFLLVAWRGTLGRRALAALGVVAAFALTVAPWAVRNTRLEKTFVAIDTMGDRNFMMGNYEYTPLYRSWDAMSMQGEKSWDHLVTRRFPPQERATQGLMDKCALRMGLEFVRENPGLTLKRDVIKFFQFWGLERELVAAMGRGYFGSLPKPAFVLFAALIFGGFAAALVAGVFGAVLCPPADWRAHVLLLLVIGFVCAMHTLVFAHSRYHLPLMPLVLSYAAAALSRARGVWARRGRWQFRLAAGLSAAFVAGWVWEVVVVDGHRFFEALGNVG